MSESEKAESSGDEAAPHDRTIPLVALGIAAFTVVFAIAFGFLATARFALGVTVGGVIGLANFLVLARVGRALTGSRKGAALWGTVYLVKVLALFGGVFLLFRSGIVPGLSIVVGLSALVPGIVVGGLLAAPRDPKA